MSPERELEKAKKVVNAIIKSRKNAEKEYLEQQEKIAHPKRSKKSVIFDKKKKRVK